MQLEAVLPGLGLRRWGRASSALLVGALLGACGNTGRNSNSFVPGDAQGGSTAGGVAGTAGVVEMEVPTQVVPGEMHRLSRFEYESTLTDVLGTPAPTILLSDAEYDGFDNNAAAQRVSEQDFDLLYQAARTLAHDVLTDATLRARFVACSDETSACAASMIDAAGLRLFRRPVRDDERAIYLKLYATLGTQGLSHEAALEQVLVSLLSSAQFIYRMEFSSQAGAEPLDPYELASRLSYLLWSSAPDDQLLEAARLAKLSDDQELEEQLARLWGDARSARFVESFAGQWLGARRLAAHSVDPTVYPSWTPNVAAAAAREMYDVFDGLLRTDGDFLDLYRGSAHDVDPLLGPFYGVTPGADGRVEVAGERASLLGSVAYLTLTSNDRRSSPTHRGLYVLDKVLCEHLPPPPANVPILDFDQTGTFRQQIEQYQQFASCRPCHSLMDPIGLALEQYDGIGRFRTAYANGEPIDPNDHLAPSPGYPAGLEARGIPGVMARVLSDPSATRCATEKLYTYAIGGMPTDVDRQNIDVLTAEWQSGPLTIKELARQIVLSKTFRYKLARVAP